MRSLMFCRQLPRLFRIFSTFYRLGLEELFTLPYSHKQTDLPSFWIWWKQYRKSVYQSTPLEIRLRLALEHLGPMFVKLGQALSTRRDLLPVGLADELSLLQDRVPPFSFELVQTTLERVYSKPVIAIFASFSPTPLASASVAQVHEATLFNGNVVAVKILRPGIRRIIEQDLYWLDWLAKTIERWWSQGLRLRLSAIIAEFRKHLLDELDLLKEAANCEHLRQNFIGSSLLKIPTVHWDYCRPEVMVMERMQGVPISNIAQLSAQHIDLKKLARAGVEIFFTQVFRDSFFHADMHPGNILVASDGKYIALDFGIMGTLDEQDKNYLAQNFLAFFRRDYRGVASAHIESGWAPKETRVDELESAIRAVCEPIFAKPLKDISLGKLLLRLFQTGRRFRIEIQPQLILLQKTLLNIEGLGRQLDPHLDLWQTAKPFLERWMAEQLGWRSVIKQLQTEYPYWAHNLPKLPRKLQKIADTLANLPSAEQCQDMVKIWVASEKRQTRHRHLMLALLALIAAALWWR